MEEKILNTRKNGMAVLLLTLLGYVASIALFIYSITLLDADRMLSGLAAADLVHRVLDRRHLPVLRPEGAQAPGSAGAHPVR